MGAGQEGRGGGDDDLRRRRRRRSEQFQLGRRRKKERGVGKTDKKCVSSSAHQYFTIFQFFSKTRLFLFFKRPLFVAVFSAPGQRGSLTR